MKKIISYSLWFQDTPMDTYAHQTPNMYFKGMIRNLEIHNEKNLYKDWTIRCYLNDTISEELQNKCCCRCWWFWVVD